MLWLWWRSTPRSNSIQRAPISIMCGDNCCSTWGASKKRRRNWKRRGASTTNTPRGRSRRRPARSRLPSYCKTRSDTLACCRDAARNVFFSRPRRKHDRHLPFWQEVRTMNRNLKIVAIVVAVLIVIVIAIPFFIDANAFRPKIETDLTAAMGRQVKVGNLSLSLLSGSVSADDISIADDPAFSKSAFVQAKSLKVGVEMMPLIFSKQLNVTELTLKEPEMSLVRWENGEKWNFSSLGVNNKSATQPAASSGNPNLTVAKLNVNNG